MTRPRIAHVLPVYSERGVRLFGGGERYAVRLAQALNEHVDVTLVTFGPRAAHGEAFGLPHLVVPARGSPPDNPPPLRPMAFVRRFDLVHAYQVRTFATSLLALSCAVFRKPLVATDLGGGGRSLMHRARLHRLIRAFPLLSEFARQFLPAEARARAVVTPGGIDLESFPFDPSPRPRRVLQVARIMPHKGMNYLIDAVAEDVELTIAGRVADAAYFERIKAQARGRRVEFVIDPSDEAVRRLYREAAVTAAPSVYRDLDGVEWPTSEYLGLPLLESMATGTPVVCTDVGGMPEYVREGETGFIVPPNQPAALRTAILRLLDDAALARRMGRAGREHVAGFTWSALAGRVLEVYREVGLAA